MGPPAGTDDPLGIALIGFGSIAREVTRGVRAGEAGSARLTGVLVRRPADYAEDPETAGMPVVGDLAALLATGPDVVVEVAGHAALREHGAAVLRSGRTLMTVSIGAFSDDELLDELVSEARSAGARLVLPSGAIAGLDAIESASLAGLETVVHTVRKPPHALLPADEAAAVVASGEPRLLYEGPAREATKRFPENVNVVAAVSVAGLGLDRTTSRVLADPTVERNTHEVHASGAFGSIDLVVRNVPGPNPKTGRIVGPSVVRALRRLRSPVVVGG
jgi:aspartate dehydrogenase